MLLCLRHAPVDASLAMQEVPTDQRAAQRRRVRVVALEDLVQLALGIARAQLESLREPLQDYEPFLALRRDLGQAVVDDKGLQDLLLLTRRVDVLHQGGHTGHLSP